VNLEGFEELCKIYWADNLLIVVFYLCSVNFDTYKVDIPTNALFIKLDKVLKFTLKITLTCSYIFFDVLLTVHLGIFISVINQIDAILNS